VVTLLYRGTKIRMHDRMASILQYALDYPKMWRKIGTDEASIAAVKKLEAAGLMKIKDYSNQYRVKP
jgi:hypothetical protein